VRVTNLGNRKWILPDDVLRPGGTVTISEDSWRLALGLNTALAFAVGSEVVVEEEARPVPELPPVLMPESEPDYIEPAAEQPAPVVEAPRKRGRR